MGHTENGKEQQIMDNNQNQVNNQNQHQTMEKFTAKTFDHIDKITLNRTPNQTQKTKKP